MMEDSPKPEKRRRPFLVLWLFVTILLGIVSVMYMLLYHFSGFKQRVDSTTEEYEQIQQKLALLQEQLDSVRLGIERDSVVLDSLKRAIRKLSTTDSINGSTGRITDATFYDIWLNQDGTEGWAVGEAGTVLRFENNRWTEIRNESMYMDAFALWVKPDGSRGWAVGATYRSDGRNDRGKSECAIMQFEKGLWREWQQASEWGAAALSDLWIKADGSEGWAIGLAGLVLRMEKGKWSKWVQSEGLPRALYLQVLWVRADGSEGWAIGEDGEIIRLEKGTWSSWPQVEDVYEYAPSAMWMKANGSEGWAVGNNGIILRFAKGTWNRWPGSKGLEYTLIQDLWMKADGSEGWAVGHQGAILRFENKRWRVWRQKEITSEYNLNALWMKADGSEGWAVGEAGIILRFEKGVWRRYSLKD